MTENSFNMRDKQRYRQTISKGEVNFRFITVDRLWNFIMHEHKLYKFAYFAQLNHGKSDFVRILKRDSVSVKWIHFYFTVILNEMFILRTLITSRLGVLDFLVCASVDWQSHSSFSTTNSAASVALESNLNRSIHFSHIVINARSILSLKLRYISFLKDEAQRTKQICIRYGWYTVGLRLPVCVCFY